MFARGKLKTKKMSSMDHLKSNNNQCHKDFLIGIFYLLLEGNHYFRLPTSSLLKVNFIYFLYETIFRLPISLLYIGRCACRGR